MVQDIYFLDQFGKLYEEIENGVLVVFNYEDRNGKIEHRFIKREIPNKNGYNDIITPYGYGGPIVTKISGSIEELIKNFDKAFSEYAIEQHIVTEFIRFHPLIKNHVDFKDVYTVEKIRKTVKTEIEKGKTFSQQFSKSTRKTIKKLLKTGYTFKVIEKPNDLEIFYSIYSDTMNRTNATEFYYFGQEYFENLRRNFLDKIILINIIKDEEIVASGLYLAYNDILHAHLSGTKTKALNDSPAYLIKYAAIEWAEENNINYLFHGGGKTSQEKDSLYLFKKKFAQNTIDDYFYTGKRVWNEMIYKELNSNIDLDKTNFYFPEYRQKQ